MNAPADLFGLTQAQFETFLLVLVRVSTILTMVPIYSAAQIPLLVRFGLGFVVSYVLWRFVPPMAPLAGLGPLTAAVISQVFVGFVFGFVVYLSFTGIQFAGEVLDIVVGFSIVNVINPLTSQTVSVIGELELALASLIYLAIDAHHFMFQGLAGSFAVVPLPFVAITPGLETDVVGFFSQCFYILFQIAAPVALALFMTNVGLALMARVAPQVNIFAVGFPLQIGVGLIMLVISMPLLGVVLPQVFEQLPRELDSVLRQMRPPA